MFTDEEIEEIGTLNYRITNVLESIQYAAPEVRDMWYEKLTAALTELNNFTAPILIRINN